LMALEETPRYRAALRLLLELDRARADKIPDAAPVESVLPRKKS
jgi:hypothetical protein